MCKILVTLFVPSYWREGLIVSLFKNGNEEDPGNYEGITLLNLVGACKLYYSRISNDRLLRHLELNNKLHEGQSGFRIGRSCIDSIFVLNELILSHMRESKSIFAFFLM